MALFKSLLESTDIHCPQGNPPKGDTKTFRHTSGICIRGNWPWHLAGVSSLWETLFENCVTTPYEIRHTKTVGVREITAEAFGPLARHCLLTIHTFLPIFMPSALSSACHVAGTSARIWTRHLRRPEPHMDILTISRATVRWLIQDHHTVSPQGRMGSTFQLWTSEKPEHTESW